MAHKIDIIPDDVSITRGLLGRPHIPQRRRTSFTSTTRSGLTEDISNDPEEGSSIKDDSRRRRGIQSSNTWTTSSGEILSDKDDIEDRTFFILEYNRLATKVGCHHSRRRRGMLTVSSARRADFDSRRSRLEQCAFETHPLPPNEY